MNPYDPIHDTHSHRLTESIMTTPVKVIGGWHKLPQELRLEILEFALTPPIELPTPSKLQPDRYERQANPPDDHFEIWEDRSKSLARDLLLVNKQFRNDVEHIVNLMSNICHLDIMVVKSYGLWHSWYLPKLPSSDYIDEVTINYRMFEPTDIINNRFKKSRYLKGRNGPGEVMCAFDWLLLQLIQRGPGFLHKKSCRNFSIKKIDISILPPITDSVDSTWLWCMEDKHLSWLPRQYACGISSRSAEEQLAYSFGSLFDKISSPSKYNLRVATKYYSNLVEGIVLRLNGVEYERLDPDRVLKDTEFDPSLARTMKGWQEETHQGREEMKKRFERHSEKSHDNCRN